MCRYHNGGHAFKGTVLEHEFLPAEFLQAWMHNFTAILTHLRVRTLAGCTAVHAGTASAASNHSRQGSGHVSRDGVRRRLQDAARHCLVCSMSAAAACGVQRVLKVCVVRCRRRVSPQTRCWSSTRCTCRGTRSTPPCGRPTRSCRSTSRSSTRPAGRCPSLSDTHIPKAAGNTCAVGVIIAPDVELRGNGMRPRHAQVATQLHYHILDIEMMAAQMSPATALIDTTHFGPDFAMQACLLWNMRAAPIRATDMWAVMVFYSGIEQRPA